MPTGNTGRTRIRCKTLATASLVWGLLSTASGQPAQLEDLSNFPRATVDITAGKHHKAHYDIWIADTPSRESQGLMFVRDLPQGQGMLFPESPPRVMLMWMKNTYVPLDMVFVGSDHRISHIVANAKPQSLDTIDSGGPVAAVLEIRGGDAERQGLQVGDAVAWKR